MKRIQIDNVGQFWEVTNPDGCCPVCAQHRYVVVQKLSFGYAMHTYVAPPSSASVCLHVWRIRDQDPPCLTAFAPTGTRLTGRVGFNQLYKALAASNNDRAVAAARNRIAEQLADLNEERPRMNWRIPENPAPRRIVPNIFREP